MLKQLGKLKLAKGKKGKNKKKEDEDKSRLRKSSEFIKYLIVINSDEERKKLLMSSLENRLLEFMKNEDTENVVFIAENTQEDGVFRACMGYLLEKGFYWEIISMGEKSIHIAQRITDYLFEKGKAEAIEYLSYNSRGHLKNLIVGRLRSSDFKNKKEDELPVARRFLKSITPEEADAFYKVVMEEIRDLLPKDELEEEEKERQKRD